MVLKLCPASPCRVRPGLGNGLPVGGYAQGPEGTGAKLNKIYTKFHFFQVLPDESTVKVVFSFPADPMRLGDR